MLHAMLQKYFLRFIIHTMTQPFSDFFHLHEAPLVQGIHLDPIELGFEIVMLLCVHPPKILTPGTPRGSLGTKIFWSKFFSHNMSWMLLHTFGGYVLQKLLKNTKNASFQYFSLL